jgi:pantothenate kinase
VKHSAAATTAPTESGERSPATGCGYVRVETKTRAPLPVPFPGMIDRQAYRGAQRLTIAELTARADRLIRPDRRTLLGITGPPGAGKSTVAAALHESVRGPAALLPMDAFHLSQNELSALGRLNRMGAPDTFDATGFVNLVERLRTRPDTRIAAPTFDRDSESSIPHAIEITPEDRLVLVEGNYLLLDDTPWSSLRDLLDEVWYVDLDEPERLERLIARHVAYGKTPDAAREWSLGPDEANAQLITATREHADLIIWLQK